MVDLAVESSLFSSKSEARRSITSGGVYINNERESDPNFTVNSDNLIEDSALLLRSGKKKYLLIHAK